MPEFLDVSSLWPKTDEENTANINMDIESLMSKNFDG
jgi:hypothetical protein